MTGTNMNIKMDQYMIQHLATINRIVAKKEHIDRFKDNINEIMSVSGAQTLHIIASYSGRKGVLAHYYLSAAIRFMYHTMTAHGIDTKAMLDYCCNTIISKEMILSIINNTQNKTNMTVCLDDNPAMFVKMYSDDLELALQADNTNFGVDAYNSKMIKKILASLEVIIEQVIDKNDEDSVKISSLLKEVLYTLLNHHMFKEFETCELKKGKWERYVDAGLFYGGIFCATFITTYLLSAMCCGILDGVMGNSIYAPSAGVGVQVAVAV